jgi:hypothetical protein
MTRSPFDLVSLWAGAKTSPKANVYYCGFYPPAVWLPLPPEAGATGSLCEP